MKPSKLITHVELTVKPEFISAVLPKAIQTRDCIVQEAGCQAFYLTRKTADPATLVIFAIYSSRATYQWHLEQAYVKTFFGYLTGKLVTPPTLTYLEEI